MRHMNRLSKPKTAAAKTEKHSVPVFVQRLSPKEIGEMLNINTNTVYAYVSRIRKILLDTKDENI